MKRTILLVSILLLASLSVWGQDVTGERAPSVNSVRLITPTWTTEAPPSLAKIGGHCYAFDLTRRVIEVRCETPSVATAATGTFTYTDDGVTWGVPSPSTSGQYLKVNDGMLAFDTTPDPAGVVTFGSTPPRQHRHRVRHRHVRAKYAHAQRLSRRSTEDYKAIIVMRKAPLRARDRVLRIRRARALRDDLNLRDPDPSANIIQTMVASPGGIQSNGSIRKPLHAHAQQLREITMRGVVKLSPAPSKTHPVYIKDAAQQQPIIYGGSGSNSRAGSGYFDYDSQQQPQQQPAPSPTHQVTIKVPPGESAEMKAIVTQMEMLNKQFQELQRKLQPIILRAEAKIIEQDSTVQLDELQKVNPQVDGDGFSWRVTRAGPDAAAQVPTLKNKTPPQ